MQERNSAKEPKIDLTSSSTIAAEAINIVNQIPETCSGGPIQRAYSRPGYFYWPPIMFNECSKSLTVCNKGTCRPTQTQNIQHTVDEFRVKDGVAVSRQTVTITITEHLGCFCCTTCFKQWWISNQKTRTVTNIRLITAQLASIVVST